VDAATFRLTVRANEEVPEFSISVTIQTYDGQKVGGVSSSSITPSPKGTEQTYRISVPEVSLAPIRYTLAIAISVGDPLRGLRAFDVVAEALSFETRLPAREMVPWRTGLATGAPYDCRDWTSSLPRRRRVRSRCRPTDEAAAGPLMNALAL
jgi:hypothetical protein